MDFRLTNELTYFNSKFKKRKRKLWTYTYPNNTKVRIGYVLMNEKSINSALNCEVYSSFESGSSDHGIVSA